MYTNCPIFNFDTYLSNKVEKVVGDNFPIHWNCFPKEKLNGVLMLDNIDSPGDKYSPDIHADAGSLTEVKVGIALLQVQGRG